MTSTRIITLLEALARDKNSTKDLMEVAIHNFIVQKPSLPVTGFHYAFIVRCSPNNLYPGEVFKNISRCSYNPYPDTIRLGRCNYPNQAVFYAAATADTKYIKASTTALLETSFDYYVRKKSVNRMYFTLSRWQLSRPLKLIVLPFSKRSTTRNNDFKKMNKEFDNLLRDMCQLRPSDYIEIKRFLVYMSNIFCRMRKKAFYYRISSAFFNVIMSLVKDVDGLAYPSAMTKAEGMNLALKKDLIDNKILQCDVVVMYSMQRNPSNPKDITFVPASETADIARNGNLGFRWIT
ncbi:MAG: hypothetical protein ACHQ1D_03020 [Nitrososphaerales archaeon]